MSYSTCLRVCHLFLSPGFGEINSAIWYSTIVGIRRNQERVFSGLRLGHLFVDSAFCDLALTLNSIS